MTSSLLRSCPHSACCAADLQERWAETAVLGGENIWDNQLFAWTEACHFPIQVGHPQSALNLLHLALGLCHIRCGPSSPSIKLHWVL